MPRHKILPIILLYLLGIFFAGWNLWTTASRSTIPLAMDGVIHRKVRLIEKQPGVDDVYLIHLDNGQSIQVDEYFYKSVHQGESITKLAWERVVKVDGARAPLEFSGDFRGMLIAMPITMLVFSWLLGTSLRSRTPLNS
ncbi:MAG: hypothetical protein IT423_22765 [Pirellulaceae bacterium]|nr:hypothetical protein [Pirellulaceae bacterium]